MEALQEEEGCETEAEELWRPLVGTGTIASRRHEDVGHFFSDDIQSTGRAVFTPSGGRDVVAGLARADGHVARRHPSLAGSRSRNPAPAGGGRRSEGEDK